jgi:indolepyruvate ferredoxin oxidoreductase alpha subunit
VDKDFSGNEALAKGVYDAGVSIATGYPGYPVTRFLEYLTEISGEEVYLEWSANEKVAFEIALGGSMAGVRTAVCFKCVGLNVAMDPLMVANLAGVVGGMLIILGDDPGAQGSQNEQDGRILARAAEIPIMEYGSPQEAYDMADYGFSLSERFKLPVMIRETGASSLERGKVKPHVKRVDRKNIPFYETTTWKNLPTRQLEKHWELQKKIPEISSEFDKAPYNKMTIKGSMGVIGVGYAARKSSMHIFPKVDGSLSFLKLGTIYPPPDKLILRFLGEMDKVLVVEEVKPFIERYIRSLSLLNHLELEVYGRDTGHIPQCGDLQTGDLMKWLDRSFCYGFPMDICTKKGDKEPKITDRPLPKQCPYYQAFHTFSEVIKEERVEQPIFIGDEGCMMRLKNPPFRMLDSKFCMGASIGMASGLALGGEKRRIVALMGDSSFFHTGISAYFNAVANNVNIIIMILNNQTTAITGCQPHPGTGLDIRGRRRDGIDLEKVIRASGVEDLYILDAFKDKVRASMVFKRIIKEEGLKVILLNGKCTKLGTGSCE